MQCTLQYLILLIYLNVLFCSVKIIIWFFSDLRIMRMFYTNIFSWLREYKRRLSKANIWTTTIKNLCTEQGASFFLSTLGLINLKGNSLWRNINRLYSMHPIDLDTLLAFRWRRLLLKDLSLSGQILGFDILGVVYVHMSL